MPRTHRIACSSPAHATALSSFLSAEGHDACWFLSYEGDVPTVLALCTTADVHLALAAVGA
jgi:hypothetical protein